MLLGMQTHVRRWQLGLLNCHQHSPRQVWTTSTQQVAAVVGALVLLAVLTTALIWFDAAITAARSRRQRANAHSLLHTTTS
jgi:hypothetical protein